MSLSTFVAALAWSSTFGALWNSYLQNDWTFAGFALIIFSFIVAILAGVMSK